MSAAASENICSILSRKPIATAHSEFLFGFSTICFCLLFLLSPVAPFQFLAFTKCVYTYAQKWIIWTNPGLQLFV